MSSHPRQQPATQHHSTGSTDSGYDTGAVRSEPEADTHRVARRLSPLGWLSGLSEEDRWRLRKAAEPHQAARSGLAGTPPPPRAGYGGRSGPTLGLHKASNNLHQILHAARRAFEPSALASSSSSAAPSSGYLLLRDEQLTLCPDSPLWVDVEAFEEAATTARHASVEPQAFRAAIDLYAGELLPEDRYEPWVEERRAQLSGALPLAALGASSTPTRSVRSSGRLSKRWGGWWPRSLPAKRHTWGLCACMPSREGEGRP